MLRSAPCFFVIMVVGTSVACDVDTAVTAPEPSASFTTATATIGPEGGELVGTPENRFPGVKLVIPPGALARPETITFAGAVDETPLPPTAERVGPQVRVLPEGLTLARPALLTLPMDRELRNAFEERPDECKVWARTGDSWRRVEPVATTESSVTIETTSFTTAATGVVLVARLPVCTDASCAIPRVDAAAACTGALGYCLSSVADPPEALQPLATSSLNVEGNRASTSLYYVTLLNGSITPVRYDLETGVSVKYARHTPALSGLIRFSRVQPVEDGSVWVMVGGYGFVKSTLGSGSTATGTTLEPEALVIDPPSLTRAEVVMQFSSLPLPGTTLRRFLLRGDNNPAFKLFDGLATDSIDALKRLPHTGFDRGARFGAGLFIAATASKLCLGNYIIRVDNTTFATCDPLREAIGSAALEPLQDDPRTISEIGSIATLRQRNIEFPETSYYALARPANAASKDVFFTNVDLSSTRTRATLAYGASSMAFDDQVKLHVVNTSRPELTIVSSDGSTRTLKLTLAAEGTDAYNAMIPRKILQIPNKTELLLLVRGEANGTKKLFRVRRAS